MTGFHTPLASPTPPSMPGWLCLDLLLTQGSPSHTRAVNLMRSQTLGITVYVCFCPCVHSTPGAPKMYRFPVLHVHGVYIPWVGAGKRALNKESICLKTSSPYCPYFALHLHKGCHIRNTSKTKNVKHLATNVSSLHRCIFKKQWMKSVQQVGPAKEIKSRINQICREAAQKLVCVFSKQELCQRWSWQYYLVLTLSLMLGNRCPTHYWAFSRLGEGSGLTLSISHYRKTWHISISVF